MKTYLITLFATVAFTGLAYAEGPKGEPPEHRPYAGPMAEGCDNLKLTDEQKSELRTERLKNEDERIDLEAKAKHAHVDLEKAMADKDADDKTILKAAQASADAFAKLRTTEEIQHVQAVLKVFKGAQREEALRCGLMHHRPDMGHGERGCQEPGPMHEKMSHKDRKGPKAPPSVHPDAPEKAE